MSTSVNFKQYYEEQLIATQAVRDEAQMNVVKEIEAWFNTALKAEQMHLATVEQQNFLSRWVEVFAGRRRHQPEVIHLSKHTIPQGIYLWGPVGRGKTWLMDLAYHYTTLPKLRIHYHQFMQQVHSALKQQRQHHATDPIMKIAEAWSKQCKCLFIDEFFVVDITDAMLWDRLLNGLLSHGVYLMITSNCQPDILYAQGLQRERFLPAIKLIQHHLKVIELHSEHDFRLRQLAQAGLWKVIDQSSTEEMHHDRLQVFWDELTQQQESSRQPLILNERSFEVIAHTEHVLWMNFEALCNRPTGAIDYVALAEQYEYILLEKIPILDQLKENAARRFITLVDSLYDRQIKLIASAEADIQSLYQGQKLKFEFMRTASRLIEMQSSEYYEQEVRHRQ